MDAEKLNQALYDKMAAEQERFKHGLLGQTVEEALNHAYEYAMREDILMEMESLDLPAPQAAALLASPFPLADIYKDFRNMDTDQMEVMRSCIETRADTLIKKQRELRETPIYQQSHQYASEHGEMEQYRVSHNANIACKDAIEKAIKEHYHDNRLSGEAVKDVIAAFGMERTSYITAIAVQALKTDPRISSDAKAWAKTVPVVDDFDAPGHNRNALLAVRQAHPGLIDLFARMVHDEAAIRKPLYKRTADHAQKYGKLEQYRDSLRANNVCRREIEAAIFETWDGTNFSPDAAKGIIDRFGVERTSYVLASSIQEKAWEDQFSSDNLDWAKTVPQFLPEDRRSQFVVSCHTVKLDAFVSLFRKEVAAMEQSKSRGKRSSIKAQLTAKPVPGDQPTAKQKDREAR